MKKIDLSILNNADDDIIDGLVTFSSDEETKKRVLAMSERKYEELINNGSENEYTISVNGVEQYRRPVWRKAVSAAAAFAIVAGGIGAAVAVMPKKTVPPVNIPAVQAEDKQSSQTEENNEQHTEVQSEVYTSEMTTTAVSIVTSTSTAAITESAAVTSAVISETTAPAGLSNDEMRKLFDDNLEVYLEAATLNSDERSDLDAEPISFWRYWGEYDAGMEPIEDNGMMREGNSLYYLATYYKVKNPRSTNIEKLKSYYSQYLYEPERQLGLGVDMSGYTSGMVIPSSKSDIDIIGYNGAIYSTQFCRIAVPSEEKGEIICDKPLYVTDTSFTWERIYKVYNADIGGQIIPVKAESIELDFEKMKDGSWKVTSGQVAGDEYNSNKDYYALDTTFSHWGGAYISPNMGIDFNVASDTLYDYFGKNIHREEAHYILWERTNTLPDSYEHITDNYINDGNWLKFTYVEAYNTDGPTIDVYTDRSGTVFASAVRDPAQRPDI